MIKRFIVRNLDSACYKVVEGQVQVAIRMTNTKFDQIIYTGSTQKGRLVAEAAAKNLVPCLLELGGKSPMIVDKSCDVEFAAHKAAFMSFMNSGQTCIRPDYILIDSSLATKFVDHMKKAMDKWYDGGKITDNLGRVVNEFHKERLCELFKDHQGTVVYGNGNAHNDKNLIPSIILNPSPDSPMMQEEIFGPILPIITTKTIDEAIEFVKSRDKPLAAYYFGTNSTKNANMMRCKNEISAGAFTVNEVGLAMANSDLPFGGVGASGMGRYHGREGFYNCSNRKSILLKVARKGWPFDAVFPPFTKSKQSLIKFASTHLDITQAQMVKRVITFWLLVFILWLIASGRAKKFWKKLQFAWKMIKMMSK